MRSFLAVKTAKRYALKREVATVLSVFPWSMSDFKPGEIIAFKLKAGGCYAYKLKLRLKLSRLTGKLIGLKNENRGNTRARGEV